MTVKYSKGLINATMKAGITANSDPIPCDELRVMAKVSQRTVEQEARDILDRMGIEDAQQMSAGDLVELANVISDYRYRIETLTECCKIKAGLILHTPASLEAMIANAVAKEREACARECEKDTLCQWPDNIKDVAEYLAYAIRARTD